MIEIQLPEDIEKRLDELANVTGQTKLDHVREAITKYLNDIEQTEKVMAAIHEIRVDKNSLGEE